jgi:hypothetical protein
MKTIRHHATLFYYDGPQVFEARDTIGGHYLALLTENLEGRARYLAVGVSPGRLREFRLGSTDLRTVLLAGADEGWFLTEAADLTEPLGLAPQTSSLADSPYLPEAGFVLHDAPAAEASLREARARNNLVLEMAVEPPEAAAEHRIRMDTLAGLLVHVQTMLKHAYGAALRELSIDTRKTLDRTDAHLMDVVIPAAAGSFRVVLEATRSPDMLGQNELARALQLVDEMFEQTADPVATLARVKKRRGHLAGAYLRLLRFLASHRSGLRYAWAEPNFAAARQRTLTEKEAQPLIDALSGVANLGAETVSFVGSLDKADRQNGSWRLLTAEGAESGETKAGGPSLEGLKLGGNYRFTCQEEIVENEGSGREIRTLYLVEREPV